MSKPNPDTGDESGYDTDSSPGGVNTGTGPMKIPAVKMPEGWYDSQRDLARHNYFTRGEGICGILEEHGFSYIHPVMMDDYDTYLIRGKKTGENTPTYFVWNPIAGTVFQVKSKNLTKIVEIMGRSVLALDMVELGDADL